MATNAGRRAFLRKAGAGLGGLTLAGPLGLFDAARARAEGAPLAVLDAAEGAALDALGETLLPGAAAAGIAHYVDHQLAAAVPLLMLPYLDFPQAPVEFYRQGLAALDALAMSGHGTAFAALEPAVQADLVGALSGANPEGWSGPPGPLFYFVVRNDAVDVVYGTQTGFDTLGVPYMPHILPVTNW